MKQETLDKASKATAGALFEIKAIGWVDGREARNHRRLAILKLKEALNALEDGPPPDWHFEKP